MVWPDLLVFIRMYESFIGSGNMQESYSDDDRSAKLLIKPFSLLLLPLWQPLDDPLVASLYGGQLGSKTSLLMMKELLVWPIT